MRDVVRVSSPHRGIEACMADFSRSLTRACAVATLVISVAACSSDSTGSSARGIVGHVTINPGEARIPSENFVGAHNRVPLTPLASHRAKQAPRVNVVFRGEAIGAGQLGAFSVRSIG